MVREQREAAGEVPRGVQAASARVGCALVEPDHQRRAPADARERRHGGPHRVQRVRLRGPGCLRLPPVHVRQQRRRRRRPQRLHPAAHTARWLPWRPHHPAPRQGSLPRHHRCVRRWPRQLLVQPAHADRRFGDVHRSFAGHLHARRVGPERREDARQDRHRSGEAVRRVAGRASRTARCATC